MSDRDTSSSLHAFDLLIRVEDALQGDVIVDKIIQVLRPNWPKQEIVSKVLSGGAGALTTLVCFALKDDDSMEDAIIVRVFDNETDCKIDRENEFMVMQMAHQSGVHDRIYGSFQNGIVYKYHQGRILDVYGPEFFNENHIRLICAKLARLHLIDPSQYKLVDLRGNQVTYPDVNTLEKLAHSWLSYKPCEAEVLKKKYELTGICIEQLVSEWDWLMEEVAALGMQRCLTHHDIWAYNILYNDETDEYNIIDYEFAGYGYGCIDFGGLYDNYSYFNALGMIPAETPEMTDEMAHQWQRIYLEEKSKLTGQEPSAITDHQLKVVSKECRICMLIGKFMALSMTYRFVDFTSAETTLPFETQLKVLWEEYKMRKEELPQLKKEYLELKSRS